MATIIEVLILIAAIGTLVDIVVLQAARRKVAIGPARIRGLFSRK